MASGYVPDVITEAVGSEPTYQMAVDQMAVDQMAVDQMAVDQMAVEEYANL